MILASRRIPLVAIEGIVGVLEVSSGMGAKTGEDSAKGDVTAAPVPGSGVADTTDVVGCVGVPNAFTGSIAFPKDGDKDIIVAESRIARIAPLSS